MNQYQKVYMNQIHSSSLLGQLAQMWRSQMLCDALIRTGNITTKAHRVVLVAACPMLQSMDNASVGSHLEVRLAADIKQEAVNSFLQYLYEGFMMLTEENCKDVEKVARLLQVDSVTKCCIDFYNCLQKKTGVTVYTNTQYKYSSADLLEFRHVRTTDLQKTIQERMMKRAAADSMRPTSPGGKRQRTQQQQQRPLSPNIDLAMFGQKADDTLSMTNSYMGNLGNQAADPWDRVPRIGAAHRPQQRPGVIEIVEDSLEILQTQPPDKDSNKSAPPIVQKSLAISVSSQLGSSTDVHVVNVNDQTSRPTAASDGPIMSTGRDSITVSPLTVLPGSSMSSSSLSKDPNKHPHDNQKESPFTKKSQFEHQTSTPQAQRPPFPVSMSPARMSPISQINQAKKSFAAGSATQAATMSQSQDSSTMSKKPSSSGANEMADLPSSDSGKDMGAKSKNDDGSTSSSADMAPDLSIVKVEPNIDDPGLDMYVDVPDDGMIQTQHRDQREHDDESDVELEEASGDWSRDEMSNEAGGSDQNNSWYIGQFKGPQADMVSLPIKLKSNEMNVDDEKTDLILEKQPIDNGMERIQIETVMSLQTFDQDSLNTEKVVEMRDISQTGSVSNELESINMVPDLLDEPDVLQVVEKTFESYLNDDSKPKRKPHKSKPVKRNRRVLGALRNTSARMARHKAVVTRQKALASKKREKTIQNKSSVSTEDTHSETVSPTPIIVTSKLARRAASVVGKRTKSSVTSLSNVEEKIHDKSMTHKVTHFFSKKGASIVGKLIPSKPLVDDSETVEHETSQGSTQTTKTRPIIMSASKINVKYPRNKATYSYPRNKATCSYPRNKPKRTYKVIIDPNFWSLPIKLIARDVQLDNRICSSDVTKHYKLVSKLDESISIPESLAKSCLEKGLNRYDFTASLYLNITTMRDVFRNRVSDRRHQINEEFYKFKLMKDIAFKLFPMSPTHESKHWEMIVDNLSVITQKIKERAHKELDLTAIEDQL